MKGKDRYKTINDYKYRIDDDAKLFAFPRAKAEKLKLLQRYVTQECENAWKRLPKQIAALKKEMLKELIDEVS